MSFQGDSQYLNGSEPLGLFLLSLTAIFCLTTLSLYMQISDFYADGRQDFWKELIAESGWGAPEFFRPED